MDKMIRALIGICLLALSGSAAATYISGTINIGGGSEVINDGTNSTGLRFNNCTTIVCGGAVNMWPAPTGDFSGIYASTGSGLTLYDFLYTDIPQQTIWEIDHGGLLYSFTLQSINVVSGDVLSSPGCQGDFGCLVLAGTGYFSITDSNGNSVGYTDTAGTWTYSQSGASFSSQSASVSEPGTIALLGLGLLGIGVASRVRKSS
jgi:hypothetical protein